MSNQKIILQINSNRDGNYLYAVCSNKTKSMSVYVGVHNFRDEDKNKSLVYDWRAPISSMFYDFELGDAFYKTSNLKVEGNIELKRQFRIRNGEME